MFSVLISGFGLWLVLVSKGFRSDFGLQARAFNLLRKILVQISGFRLGLLAVSNVFRSDFAFRVCFFTSGLVLLNPEKHDFRNNHIFPCNNHIFPCNDHFSKIRLFAPIYPNSTCSFSFSGPRFPDPACSRAIACSLPPWHSPKMFILPRL